MRKSIGWILLSLAAVGCERQDSSDIVTQTVPKQPPPATMATPSSMPSGAGAMAAGGMPPLPGATVDPNAESAIGYFTPTGWMKEPAKSMRVVSFTVADGPPNGAEMIVSKFPANSGSVLDNINRWRGQVGLAPAQSESDSPSTLISVGGTTGKRYDFQGAQKRLVVAWVEKDGTWWFFKLLGPSKIMDEQAGNFDQFIQSVKWQ